MQEIKDLILQSGRQNSDTQVKKCDNLYSFPFSSLNPCSLLYDPCGEMLVIKGTFCRLFNLFPLKCRIFKKRLSERQQKGKLFRGTAVPKSLWSQGKPQITECISTDDDHLLLWQKSRVKSVQVNYFTVQIKVYKKTKAPHLELNLHERLSLFPGFSLKVMVK